MAQGSEVLENHIVRPDTQGQYDGGAGLPPKRHVGGADDPSGERTQAEHDAAILAEMDEQVQSGTVEMVNPGIHIPDIIGNLMRRSSRAPYLGEVAVNVWGQRISPRRAVPFILNDKGEFSRLN